MVPISGISTTMTTMTNAAMRAILPLLSVLILIVSLVPLLILESHRLGEFRSRASAAAAPSVFSSWNVSPGDESTHVGSILESLGDAFEKEKSESKAGTQTVPSTAMDRHVGESSMVDRLWHPERHTSPPLPPPPLKSNWTSSVYVGGGDGLGRFPSRTDPSFAEECGWTLRFPPPPSPSLPTQQRQRDTSNDDMERWNCTILVRPNPKSREGIAEWLSYAASGYAIALQAGCRFLLDYGEGIDVARVLEPAIVPPDPAPPAPSLDGTATAADAEVFDAGILGLYNWTTPPGFECVPSDNCWRHGRRHNTGEWDKPNESFQIVFNRTDVIDPPNYRFAANQKRIHSDHVASTSMPGFKLETSFACSFVNMMRLSRTHAADYEPRLFDEILPSMHDPTALVLALYVRTGSVEVTDGKKNMKKKKELGVPVAVGRRAAATADDDENRQQGSGHSTTDLLALADNAIECAKKVEQMYLLGTDRDEREGGREEENSAAAAAAAAAVDYPASPRRRAFSSVVWLFLTDRTDLRARVYDAYDSSTVEYDPSLLSSHDPPPPIRRRILITSTRAAHTRSSSRRPSTSDFAEAAVDWYLIGEADIVVVDRGATIGSTFGTTGAMRTARPTYEVRAGCERRLLVWPPDKKKKRRRRKVVVDGKVV